MGLEDCFLAFPYGPGNSLLVRMSYRPDSVSFLSYLAFQTFYQIYLISFHPSSHFCFHDAKENMHNIP